MEKNKEPVLLIDGDILNFTVGRVTEDVSDFGDQICKSFDEEAIVRLLDQGIADIGEKCGYTKENMIYAISCEKNYRKEHFPTYKANRSKVVKPQGLKWMRQYLKDNAEKYNLLLIENLEADDALGIFGTSGDTNISIYSQDKDLYTIPIRQWCFRTHKFIVPTPLDSIRFLYTQVLTGDTVDNYKGLPKTGKVKAEAALRDCTNELEMLQACYVRYHKVYNEDAKKELLIQIGQARILHQIDYIALVNFNETYDPFKILDIDDKLLRTWHEDYHEELAAAKKKPKKRKVVKDAI